MKQEQITIWVFWWSWFYDLLENYEEIEVNTIYWKPSDKLIVWNIGDKKVIFLPRHWKNHTIPPHKINYRANIKAFKNLWVNIIIWPCAAWSLKKEIMPWDFVILDQFVDRTNNRIDTFFDWPKVIHIWWANPYCESLKNIILNLKINNEITIHKSWTVVVVNWPRFSTKAESSFYKNQWFEVINMTQYPEVVLVRESEICYCWIALITDYDVWIYWNDNIEPVNVEIVLKILKENNDKAKKLIFELIKNIPNNYTCECQSCLKNAKL